jgi:hypothetical protein
MREDTGRVRATSTLGLIMLVGGTLWTVIVLLRHRMKAATPASTTEAPPAPIEQPVGPLETNCPDCGRVVSAGSRFCDACGRPLIGA